MKLPVKPGLTKVRKTKLTARDIQENCLRIKAAMDKTKVGTPEWKELSEQLEKQQTILRKYKDARYYVTPKDWAIIGGTTIAFVFLIGLSREWPTALKAGSIILKMMPFKG